MKDDTYVSLLWPEGEKKHFYMDDYTLSDLDMTKVLASHEALISKQLLDTIRKIPTETQVVRYRQSILNDLANNNDLLNKLLEVAEVFSGFRYAIKFTFERDPTLYNVLKRVEESQGIVDGLYGLLREMKRGQLESEGLKAFREMLESLVDSDLFRAYEEDLKALKAKEQIRAIKIGLNLDGNLKPVEAIVLTLEEEAYKFTRPGKALQRIVGHGIHEISLIPRRLFAPETVIPKENLTMLEKVIAPAMGQLLKFIDTFNDAILDVFEPLKYELSYYVLGKNMKDHLLANGYKVCQLAIDAKGPYYVKHLYNVNLAYHLITSKGTMVYNDLTWHNGEMSLLTGANRGGKTTYTQSLGQLYWLGLLGFYVGSEAASMPMIDGIYVHFPREESVAVQYGRLGEECQRFAKMFGKMTENSLLLMNETFSGTSHFESLEIAREALLAVAHIKASGIYNTHLHELAAEAGDLNEKVQSRAYHFRNLVAGSALDHQSFLVEEATPLGQSYAYEIACQYGVSYDQLMQGEAQEE